MPVIGLWGASGEPLLGARPTFASFVGRDGTARPAPEIEEVGGGLYRFAPSRADEAAGVAFLVDCGPDAAPRYYSGSAGAIVAVALYGASGEPWAGAAPSFTFYEGDQPPITRLGAGLFGFSPSENDRKAGVGYMLAAPAGASPAYYSGTVPGIPSPAMVAALPLRLQLGVGPSGGAFTIKAGDTTPALPFRVTDRDGLPVDLSYWTPVVTISAGPGAPPIVSREGSPTDALDGRGELPWQGDETLRPGTYRVTVTLIAPTGALATAPGVGYGLISIEPALRRA